MDDYLMFSLIIFLFFLVLLLLIFWISTLIKCLNSQLKPDQKLFWVIVIVILSIIGAVLFLLFYHSEVDTIKRSKKESRKEKGCKNNIKQLRRSVDNKIIAGVCGGIGEYLEIDPTIVRVVWIVFTLIPVFFGAGLLAYILFWIVMPKVKK